MIYIVQPKWVYDLSKHNNVGFILKSIIKGWGIKQSKIIVYLLLCFACTILCSQVFPMVVSLNRKKIKEYDD